MQRGRRGTPECFSMRTAKGCECVVIQSRVFFGAGTIKFARASRMSGCRLVSGSLAANSDGGRGLSSAAQRHKNRTCPSENSCACKGRSSPIELDCGTISSARVEVHVLDGQIPVRVENFKATLFFLLVRFLIRIELLDQRGAVEIVVGNRGALEDDGHPV